MLDEMLLAGELQEPSKKVPDPFCFCFSLVASCHYKISAHSCVSHAVFLPALVPTAVPICMFVCVVCHPKPRHRIDNTTF